MYIKTSCVQYRCKNQKKTYTCMFIKTIVLCTLYVNKNKDKYICISTLLRLCAINMYLKKYKHVYMYILKNGYVQ